MTDKKFDYSNCIRSKWPKLSPEDQLIEARLLRGIEKLPMSSKDRADAHRSMFMH
jgi:hypothetical protein